MRIANKAFLFLSYAGIIGAGVFIFFLFLPYDVFWAISLPIVIIFLGFFLIWAGEDSYADLPVERSETEKLKFFGNILHFGSYIFFRIIGVFFKV